MVNFVVVVILLIIIGAAIVYIMKAKKNGVKCIGCPAGAECSHSHGGGCGCGCGSNGEDGCHTDTKE